MKNWKLSMLLFCIALCGLAACSDDGTEDEPQTYQVTAFESTTIPAAVPGEGGTYKLTFVIKSETRAEAVFEPWAYRLTLGDAVGDPVKVTKPTTEVELAISANRTKEARAVVVEMASDAKAEKWTKVVEAKQEGLLKDYQVTKFESTTIPASVPFVGGDYEVKFSMKIETRSEPQFEPWQYRLTVGGTVGEPVKVTEPTESVAVHIDGNYSESEIGVVFETADLSDKPVWTKVVEAKQQPALEKVAEHYWAKGNVTLRNGRFALCEKMSETGLFFRHESRYGVKSDESTYSGTAYTPDPVQIAIDAIPQNEGVDPCSMISDKLRLPTYIEFYYLYDQEDYMNAHTLDGVAGMGYVGSSFFMPCGGYMDIPTSSVMGHSTNGGFWASGSNYEGNGNIYALSTEYSLLDYDRAGQSMGMIRCVKNTRKPSYVSHTPTEAPADHKLYSMTIQTDPGEFDLYEVALEADDGSYTQTDATDKKTEVTIHVPTNDSKEARTWRLFVNRTYAGVEFVQPGISNYAFYVSHTPAQAEAGAFTLSVTCDSDMASFPVVIKGSDGGEWSGTGSKSSPVVEIEIPENTATTARTLSIWVNGVDTGKSVKQARSISQQPLSVEWSAGYLTVKDGAYVFTAPQERGLYFKHNSRYGFALEDPISSSSKYSGTVYGPEPKEMAYADIPCDEVDPCSLVAPAGTWRMPTEADFKELIDSSEADTDNHVFTVGGQTLQFLGSGIYYASSNKLMVYSTVTVWTGTPHDTKVDYYKYFMWGVGTPKVAAGAVKTNSLQVRCVRAK